MTRLTVMEYMCHQWLRICFTLLSFPHSWLITGFLTRITRRVPLVEQELFTLLVHLRLPPFFSGNRITRSLVLCVCFVDRCLSLCTFFSWPLCCLSFDLRILITPLVSSDSSYPYWFLGVFFELYLLFFKTTKSFKHGGDSLYNMLKHSNAIVRILLICRDGTFAICKSSSYVLL